MIIQNCEQEIIKFGVWLTKHGYEDIEQMFNDYNNYKDNNNLLEPLVMPKLTELEKEHNKIEEKLKNLDMPRTEI